VNNETRLAFASIRNFERRTVLGPRLAVIVDAGGGCWHRLAIPAPWRCPRGGRAVVVMFGGALVALAWVVNSFTASLFVLYAGAVIAGVGAGAVYGTCVGNALKWFPDRRGLAAGATAAGFGAGAALTVIPIAETIENFGYHVAFFAFGLGQGLVIILLSWFLRAPVKGAAAPPSAKRRKITQTRTHGAVLPGGLPVARRQTRRCLRVLRGRYQGRGTAPVLLERRQFGERAHPYGHVHRQHRAAPRHGWRTPGQGSGRDGAGGIHHAKQWRLDHVRQIPELTADDTGDHRLAAITLSPLQSYWSKSNAWYRVRRSVDAAQRRFRARGASGRLCAESGPPR
jgi:hypothetical protein